MTIKDDQFTTADWYELWTQQSKIFFETAEQNLKKLFENNKFVNPQEHLQLIDLWLDNLKKQWNFAKLTPEQEAYQTYWKSFLQLTTEACDLMKHEWIKRSQDGEPIKNIQELYELWLKCCYSAYQNSLQANQFQNMTAEFMKAAMKFWKQ